MSDSGDPDGFGPDGRPFGLPSGAAGPYQGDGNGDEDSNDHWLLINEATRSAEAAAAWSALTSPQQGFGSPEAAGHPAFADDFDPEAMGCGGASAAAGPAGLLPLLVGVLPLFRRRRAS